MLEICDILFLFFSGFELYSMVPSICPLETLHNSLSLKQVDDFLASIAAASCDNPQISGASFRNYFHVYYFSNCKTLLATQPIRTPELVFPGLGLVNRFTHLIK